MSGISGPFDALDDMIKQVEAIAGKGPRADAFRGGLLEACAKGALDCVDAQFIATVDPYGKAWAPLKSRKGKPLSDTGVLASGFTYHVTQSGFTIDNATPYAAYHQYGATIAPHSRLNQGILFDKSGRFTSYNKDGIRKATKYWSGTITYGSGMTIPRRQMVPMAETGGIGEKWAAAINEEAAEFMKAWLK